MSATIVVIENIMRALLIASFIPAAVALAQGADFSSLDRNGDGYLTRLEAAAEPEVAKRFAQFDTDKDRRLSSAEYAAAREDNERRAQRDAALTARVKAALNAERSLPSARIAVEAYEGAVHLSGFVPVADMASRAGRITAAVSGVRTVHNNIAVK
jgi:osmotically-inducible protein OsmY